MPWKTTRPTERQSERERVLNQAEVWYRIKFFQFTWSPGVIPADTIATFTIDPVSGDVVTKSVTGMRVGMAIKLTAPSVHSPGLLWDATVTTNDQVSVWIQNVS